MAESLGEAVLRLGADLNPLQRDLAEARGMSVREMARTARQSKKATAGIFLGLAVTVGGAFAKMGEEFDEAFDTIRIGTGATGKALEGLKEDFRAVFREVPADADAVATAIADINTRLGLTGPPLRRMARQLIELSRITDTDLATNIRSVTRAFGDWKVEADEQPELLDKMFRASQATGITVSGLADQMTEAGVQLRAMGFGVDETIALLSRFEKEGIVSSRITNSLRMGLARMAQEGVTDTAKRMRELIKEIETAGSVGEATRIAIETFGSRAGPDMALAIREGRLEVGDLIKQIKNGEDTITGVAEDTDDWRESLLKLRNRALLALEKPASQVFDLLGRAAEGAGALFEIFDALPGPIKAVAVALVALGAIAAINPWVALITATLALVGIIVENWDAIKEYLGGVWDWISERGAAVWDWISEAAGNVADFIRGVWDGILFGIRRAIDTIAGLITSMMNVVADMVDKLSGLPIIGSKFKGLADGIRSSARSIDEWREDLRAADEQRKRNERGLSSLERLTRGRMGQIAGITDKRMQAVKTAMAKGSDQGREALARNYDRAIRRIQRAMDQGEVSTKRGLARIEELMIEQLRLYGIKNPKGFLQESKAKLDRARERPQDVRSLATGGVLVPGPGAGDVVPLHIGGRLAAYVSPGELVSVLNKRATETIMGINEAIPHRMAGGGIIELLWRTKGHYDHLHVAMSSVAAIIQLGRRLQKMGYQVGEHPAFGGVAPVHTAGSYHYSAQALDINADGWPGGEMAALDRLYKMLTGGRLPGGGGIGALGANIKLPRFAGTSPMGEIIAARLNQLSAGMESELSSRLGSVEGVEGRVGKGGASKAMLANLWTNAGGSPAVANLAAAIALAESGGNERAINHNSNGTWDAGFWQINQIHGYPLEWLLRGPNNAAAAVQVWRAAGRSFSPWVTYNRGLHTQYLRDGGLLDLPFLGAAHTGGVKATQEGLVHVTKGEQMGFPAQGPIQLVLAGDGAALIDELVDEMYAVLDGERVEIVKEVNRELGRGRSRAGQRAGSAGRGA